MIDEQLSSPRKWQDLITNPVDRTPLNITDGYNPQMIHEFWQSRMQTEGNKYILDLDENVANTAEHWVDVTNRTLQFLGVSKDKLPSYDDVYNVGGPSSYYPTAFPDIFPDTPDGNYEVFADEMRFRTAGNVRGPQMTDGDRLIQTLTNTGELIGGLTARPATRAVKMSTERQLRNYKLNAEMPILYKPVDVPLSKSSEEKLKELDKLVNSDGAKGFAILIDDSVSTAQVIQNYNRNRGEKRPIIQILNREGPLTDPNIMKKKFAVQEGDGVFIMDSWDDLPKVIEQVEVWKKSLAA